jgi:glycosyltransferase involved in cell wall biosynthesis
VHAHNLLPTLGWRALAAAREAGARVVLHLHQYRLVCAIGVCFTRGADCTRCHGPDTLPGVLLNCRGSRPEALAYGASLALWQRRMAAQADVVIVPSEFARERLRELGAPLRWERVHVLAPPLRSLDSDKRPAGHARRSEPGGHALVVSRLSPEKGVAVAIDACRIAGLRLVVAGDGPQRDELRERARGADVTFVGHVGGGELDALRARASVALVPSLAAETFGLAAAEAMAAGLPVVASRIGALAELLDADGLVPAGNAEELAAAIERRRGDSTAGQRGWERVRALCAPRAVATKLAAVYAGGGEAGA